MREKPYEPWLLEKISWRSNMDEHQDERQEGPKRAHTAQKGTKHPWRSLFTGNTYRAFFKNEELRDKIVNLVLSIRDLYPTIETRNPYSRLIKRHLPEGEAYQQVLSLLIHGITSMNHMFRYCHRGYYLSDREDVLNALQLLKPEIKELHMLQKSARESYSQLYKEYGYGLFSRKEAGQATGYSKTHIQRLLSQLHELKLIHREGHANRGYRYHLRSLEQ